MVRYDVHSIGTMVRTCLCTYVLPNEFIFHCEKAFKADPDSGHEVAQVLYSMNSNIKMMFTLTRMNR